MKNKLKFITVLSLLFLIVFSLSVLAITESDVETAVKSSSKENVSGNVFVWFLCAIAFMKVSQKIDSFIASLGISVGRTGGSMMAEAMIAGRAIEGALRIGKGVSNFGRGGGTGGNGGKGGFFGGIGRKFSGGATSVVTGKGNVVGLIGCLGRKAYADSVNKGGSFATSIISSVARGDISQMGTISGDKGKAAMESYFGYNSKSNTSVSANTDVKNSSSPTLNQGGATSIVSENPSISSSSTDNPSFENNMVDNQSFDLSSIEGNSVPVFSDIEMGGGRITGVETTPDFPEGRAFAMYDAEKYAKPDGNFETIKAVDKSTWYKQYAQPTVERTPYMEKGKVQYNEKIVDKIPKAPSRKDKI